MSDLLGGFMARSVTTITQPLTTSRHFSLCSTAPPFSLSARPSFQSSFTGKASRRHWPPPPPQKLSLSPSPFCLSLSLLYVTDRKNFTSGFGDSKRVDQELQQLIYLTTFRCKLGFFTMNIDYFKKDIDDLIAQFTQDESKTLADMKRVWISKKFSYIYEACPSTNLAFFMQSVYAHCIGYMASTVSLSHRLGGLYCLYCLYETQPFKPPFKVYISLGELKNLRILVVDAKANDIRVVSTLVKRMLERNMFLFGVVDLMESSVTETVNQLEQVQNARIQVAYEKLFGSTPIENYVRMDLGMEVDLNLLKKMSAEYAEAKNVAIKEASSILDVQNIKHISEDKELIGDVVEKIADEWQVQKQTFYKQTGLVENDGYEKEQDSDDDGYEHFINKLLQQDSDDDENNKD